MTFNLKNHKLSRSQKIELFLHLLFCLFIFTSIRVDWTSNWFDKSIRPDSPAPLSVLLFFFQFYINAFFLIPRFFNLKKAHLYILGAFLFFILPELLRSGFIDFLDNGISFKEELFSRDSFLFGSPSILPLSIFLSFAYRFTHNWFTNIRKTEQLEALKVKNELAQLKAQINPHFLFNNLNTLDNLINPRNEKASNYLHKLSSIYRYFLKNTDKDLISLKKEWESIDDYIYLLKVRYNDAYIFTKKNKLPNLNDYVLPPGTLQGLVENVVKHNRGNLTEPLEATLTIDDSGITISNLIKPKNNIGEKSNKGLENIKRRIQLLNNQEVFIEKNEHFSVRLPLIARGEE